MIEVEFKFPVSSLEEIRHQLQSLGAISKGVSIQTDEYGYRGPWLPMDGNFEMNAVLNTVRNAVRNTVMNPVKTPIKKFCFEAIHESGIASIDHFWSCLKHMYSYKHFKGVCELLSHY